MIKVVLSADHGGFDLKEALKNYMVSLPEVCITDLGAVRYNADDDYPDFAILAAKAVAEQKAQKAIIICGSGVGACVTANKIKGARACVCHDTYSPRQGVEHDDMNVLCLGGRVIGIEVAKEIVLAFCNATFSDNERHKRRLEKIILLEK